MASLQETPIGSPRGVYVERQRANIYTMMLVIALLAITVACACLWAEMNDYNWDVRAAGAKVTPEPALDIEQLLQQSGTDAGVNPATAGSDQQPGVSAGEAMPADDQPDANADPMPPAGDDSTAAPADGAELDPSDGQ